MIRILHLSDPHFGAADSAVAAAFLTRAAELAPDLTLLSGDLTMRARRGELASARKFVDALPSPRLVIPGNHDIPGMNQPIDRFVRPFHRYQGTFGHELEPEYRAEGVHIVSLNSTRAFGLHADWSEGRLQNSQLRRVDQQFAGGAPALRVLMLHHPLLAPEGYGRAVVHPLPDLIESIHRSNVDLVLCGHFHRSHLAILAADGKWQSIVSQAATVCSTRLQGEPNGFHEIISSGEQMEIIRHRFVAGSFVPDADFLFHRSAAGWSVVHTDGSNARVSVLEGD